MTRQQADLDLARRINEALPEFRRVASDMAHYGIDDDESESVEDMVELLEEAAGRLVLRAEELT